MLNPDTALILVNKKKMLKFMTRILSGPSILNEFLSIMPDMVFDNYALSLFYENNCICQFFKFFDTEHAGTLKLDFTGLCPNVRNEFIVFLESATKINGSIIGTIMLQSLIHNETWIFAACIDAIVGTKLNLITVFKEVINYSKTIERNNAFEKNINNCLYYCRNMLSYAESVKMFKCLIKAGIGYEVLPTSVDECPLFSKEPAKCFKKIFSYACKYDNQNFVSGLMKYHKKYVTEEVIKEYTCVAVNTVLLISNARNEDSKTTEMYKTIVDVPVTGLTLINNDCD